MTANDPISFSKYGKTFQEKLVFLILDDRVFADRMLEVLKSNHVLDDNCCSLVVWRQKSTQMRELTTRQNTKNNLLMRQ